MIAFATGIHEEVDPKMLPEGNLRSVTNLRIRRGAQLGVRFGYDALGLAGEGAVNIIPYDIMSFDGKLLAMASADTSASPNDLMQYINITGQDWRHSLAETVSTSNDNKTRLGRVSNIRELARLSMQAITFDCVDVAAGGGKVCVVASNDAPGSPFLYSSAQVTDAATDTLVHTTRIVGAHPRAVAVGSVFYIVTRTTSSSDTLELRTYDLSSANSITLVGNVSTSPASLSGFDMAPRADSSTGFLTAECRGTSVIVRVFNSSGSETSNFSFTVTTGSFVSLVEHATGTPSVTVAVTAPGKNEPDITTFVTSSGSVIAGPTPGTGGGGETESQVGLVSLNSGTRVGVLVHDPDFSIINEEIIRITNFDTTSHAKVTTGIGCTNVRWGHTKLVGKPVGLAATDDGEEIVFGGAFVDESSNATSILCQGLPCNMHAASANRLTMLLPSDVQIPSIAHDVSTGKYYWANSVTGAETSSTVVVSEFDIDSTARRQTASANGELYMSGGAPLVFDGRALVDCGYIKPPTVGAVTQGTGGTLALLGTYQFAFVYEWDDAQGKTHQSEPSEVHTETLTGSNDEISLEVSGHLSSRYNDANNAFSGVRVVMYRSQNAPAAQLHRETSDVSTEGAYPGKRVLLTTSLTDTILGQQGVIYTQGATGSRSGPTPFVAPEPCSSVWASADKLLTGGLPDQSQIQESRAAFPNEPITWAANLGGKRGIRSDVLAVASLDERRIIFTAEEIFQIDGEGLDINGVGDLGPPRKLPAACGLHGGRDGWRSLVESDAGLFYQGVTRLIYMLPRGGGAPIEVGAPVQDTLTDFPDISAATYCQEDQTVCFACNNVAGTDAVILTYDISEGQWSKDEEPGAVLSLTHLDGKLIILRADNTIHQQRDTHPAAAFVDTEVVTGTIHPFAHGMEGQVDSVALVVEYRGDCVITAFLSNDDGSTEANLGTKIMTSRTVGSTITLTWHPDVMVGNRFRLRFTCTEESGSTEGIRYNYAVLHSTGNGQEMQTDDADRA